MPCTQVTWLPKPIRNISPVNASCMLASQHMKGVEQGKKKMAANAREHIICLKTMVPFQTTAHKFFNQNH
jgi:hypothetical protein